MTDKTLNLFGETEVNNDRTSHLNSYLKVAYTAISIENRPLHTLEILKIATDHHFLPDHLYGKTPHKTLNARLAEHIRAEGTNSLFFRTKPATYFLTDLAEQPDVNTQYKVFHGVRRSKQIAQEDVLVAPRQRLQEEISGFSQPFDEVQFRSLYADACFFKDRAAAEEDETVKQFVTFTIFHHEHHLLIYKRGSYSTASTRLQGAYSVGFGGHVNNDDFDLFTDAPEALLFNSSRELLEELYLDKFYDRIDAINDRSTLLGLSLIHISEPTRPY